MPRQNCFRHQPYAARNSPTIPTTVTAVRPDQIASVDAGETLKQLKVRHIFLVHGTFVGDDPFGLAQKLDELTQSVPLLLQSAFKMFAMESWGRVLRSVNQQLSGRLMGETGSFRDDYLIDLREFLETSAPIVERFDWSSGNDHISRAEAAVDLFNRLVALPIDTTEDRILLWGHSHAGNVFALLSNLLANDRDSVEQFFRATSVGTETNSNWVAARERLAAAPSPHPLAKALCLVTMGTPVKYGWDCDGYSRLLHIVHHRPAPNLAEFVAKPALPQSVEEIVGAKFGDWVQSFGIAGSDLAPMDRRRREVNRALGQILETGLDIPQFTNDNSLLDRLPEAIRSRIGDRMKELSAFRARLNCGSRIPADGDAAWLFDYGAEETQKLGHGTYTKRSWLPFHATRIADWLRKSWET